MQYQRLNRVSSVGVRQRVLREFPLHGLTGTLAMTQTLQACQFVSTELKSALGSGELPLLR